MYKVCYAILCTRIVRMFTARSRQQSYNKLSFSQMPDFSKCVYVCYIYTYIYTLGVLSHLFCGETDDLFRISLHISLGVLCVHTALFVKQKHTPSVTFMKIVCDWMKERGWTLFSTSWRYKTTSSTCSTYVSFWHLLPGWKLFIPVADCFGSDCNWTNPGFKWGSLLRGSLVFFHIRVQLLCTHVQMNRGKGEAPPCFGTNQSRYERTVRPIWIDSGHASE